MWKKCSAQRRMVFQASLGSFLLGFTPIGMWYSRDSKSNKSDGEKSRKSFVVNPFLYCGFETNIMSFLPLLF